MSAIKELIEKTMDNNRKIESGERSIAKGKVLNESANIVIRLALLQLQQCPEHEIKRITKKHLIMEKMTQEEIHLKTVEWLQKKENSNIDYTILEKEGEPKKGIMFNDIDAVTKEQWKELEVITGDKILNSESD